MSSDAAAASPLTLGRVEVGTPLVLAPMAGVTDQAFRRLCRNFALAGLGDSPVIAVANEGELVAPAGLFVNEMVTARALLEGNQASWAMVEPDPEDPVRSVQLYGTDPETLAAATKLLVERGLADHIDLNFGCPVPKVTRKGGGAAIPWKKDLFASIVASVVQAADRSSPEGPGAVPVTVKMRIGIDDQHITAFDAAQTAQSLGVAAVGLHARTQEQYYSGAARWEHISRLKELLNIPVLGNGDVFSAADALAMMEQTGCDAVTIGRGCQGRPWLFQEIGATLHGRTPPHPPALEQVSQVLLEHARLAIQFDGIEARAMKELRKHIGWYLRGFAIGGPTRRALGLVSTYAELEALVEELDLDQAFPAVAERNRGRKGSARRPHLPEGWLSSRYLSDTEKDGLDDEEAGDGG